MERSKVSHLCVNVYAFFKVSILLFYLVFFILKTNKTRKLFSYVACRRQMAVNAAAGDGWRVVSVWLKPCWGPWVQCICRGKKEVWHAAEECQSQTVAHDECEPWQREQVKLHLPLSCALLSPLEQYTHLLSLQCYRDCGGDYSLECSCAGSQQQHQNIYPPSLTFLLEINILLTIDPYCVSAHSICWSAIF